MAKKTDVWYPERVVDGKFITRPVLQIMRELEDQQVEVCIRPLRRYVSHPQRGYYFGVVIYLLGECMRGHGVNGPMGGPITDQEVHKMMQQRFLRVSILVNPETGEYVDYVESTTEITAGKMTWYIEEIRRWAMEVLNLSIPDPGEQMGLRFA